MKKTLIIILTIIGFLSFGQTKVDQIDKEVYSIESNFTLKLSEYDWTELTKINTDGGGIFKVWKNGKQICKIEEEIELSYGKIKTIMYLQNGLPIKIIETEENFEKTDQGLNYKKLNEVFKVIIHVLDWEMEEGEIKQIGKRIMSEGTCATYDYISVIERAKKATAQ